MKFETTSRFDNDFKSLPRAHQDLFKNSMKDFSSACDAYVAEPGSFRWPTSLRVGRLSSAPRVWEMTWSFAGPDGRATFEFVVANDETRARWRRIGRHGVFTDP